MINYKGILEYEKKNQASIRNAGQLGLPTYRKDESVGEQISRWAGQLQKSSSVARTSFTRGDYLSALWRKQQEDPVQGQELYQEFLQLESNPQHPLYSPYRTPTNKAFIQQLTDFGLDTSNIDDGFFQQNAWLQSHYRLSGDGTPLAPTKKSKPEERASYAYWKLYQDEERTKKAESEWMALIKDRSYWAGRADRNYSDDELIAQIDWSKYPTLVAMDEAKKRGAPMMLNRLVEYSQDALYGVIWAARNGESGKPVDNYLMRMAQGEGQRYLPDPETKKRLDPTSATYNPYLTGSTLDKEAAFFGVSAFDRDWLDKNAGIMGSMDQEAMSGYQQVYTAEARTREAEEELQDLNAHMDQSVRLIAKKIKRGTPVEVAIAEHLSENYGALNRLAEGIQRRQPVGTTRAIGFDYHGLKQKAQDAAHAEWLRENDSKKASEFEKNQVKKAEGDITQQNNAPKSHTNPGSGGFWNVFRKGLETSVTWLMDTYGHEIPGTAPKSPLPEPGDAGASLPDGARQMASVGLSDAGMGAGDREAERAALKAELDALQPTINKTAWNLQSIQEQEKAKARAKEIQAELDKLPAPTVEITPISGDYGEYSFGAPVEDWDKVQAEREAFDANKQRERDEKREKRDLHFEELKAIAVPEGYVSENKSPLNQFSKLAEQHGWETAGDIVASQVESASKKGFFDQTFSYLNTQIPERDREMYLMLSPEQVQRYNYIYDKHGKKEAELYYEGLKRDGLNQQYRELMEGRMVTFSEEAPALASAVSVVLALGSSAEGIQILVDNILFGTDLETDDPRLIYTAMSQVIRQTVPKDWGEAQQWWYAVGMSIADNLLRRGVMGGASLVGAFGSSASGTMEKVMAAGGTSDQAQLLGLLSGSIEAITENLQFDRFTAMLKAGGGAGAREMIKGMLFGAVKNAVPEALEEGLSSILNTVADVAVRGADSDLMRAYALYLSDYQGDSEKAWDSVTRDFVKEVGMDMLGGAASGAVFGEIAVIGNAFHTKANLNAAETTYQQLRQTPNIHSEDAQAQSAALMAQITNSYTAKQLTNPNIIAKLAPYHEVIAGSMGFDNNSLSKMAAKVLEKSAVRPETAAIEAVKNLSDMKPDNQAKVIEQVLNQNLSLSEVQALAKLNILKNTSAPYAQNAETDAMINEKLMMKAVEALSTASTDIEGGAFYQAIELSGMQENGLQFALERWGQEGLHYITNLVNSGNKLAHKVAAVLQSMPTYAQSVVVAETNMRSLAITQNEINEQLAAFAADMADEQVMENTANRAVEQAVSLKSDALLKAENPEMNYRQQTLQNAQTKAEESAAALNEAKEVVGKKIIALQETLSVFLENPTDAQATKAHQQAIDDYQKARDAENGLRKNVEKDFMTLQTAQEEAENENARMKQMARTQVAEEMLERMRLQHAEAQQTAIEQQAAQEAQQPDLTQINWIVEEAFFDKSDEEQELIRERMIARHAQWQNQAKKQDVPGIENLIAYDEHQKENWKQSKRIVIYDGKESLETFLAKAIKEPQYNGKIYFGKISPDTSLRVESETGVVVEGYNLSLAASEVRKILTSHGDAESEALRGQRGIDFDDFYKIVEVVTTADKIEKADDYHGKPGITFEKTLENGKTVAFTYRSDRSHDLVVHTMYGWANERGLAQPLRGSDPSHLTSETPLGTASESIIPETGADGNTALA